MLHDDAAFIQGGGCLLIFLLLNAVFILGQPLFKGSVYVRVAFIEINTVMLVKGHCGQIR